MECLGIEKLGKIVLPSRLPAGTQLGVWKRSTGYEIVMPYRMGRLLWLLRTGILIVLIAVAGVYGYALMAERQGMDIYFGMILFALLAYVSFYAITVGALRAAQLRIDVTPLTLTITRIRPSGPAKKIGEIPVRQIEEICIKPSRGLLIKGWISDILFSVWVGQGLSADDLYYLACVIGRSTQLTLQDANPFEH